MKKIFVLLISFLTLVSCGDELEFNSPAIQAKKDGVVWRAQIYAADIDFGGFLFEGKKNGETLQLVTSDDTRGTYSLGGESPNVAIFKDANGVVYSTANEPDPSISVYPAEGQIIVEDIDNNDPKGIYGTFWFNAYTSDGLNTINFNQGVFYKVPLLGGLLVINN